MASSTTRHHGAASESETCTGLQLDYGGQPLGGARSLPQVGSAARECSGRPAPSSPQLSRQRTYVRRRVLVWSNV